MKNKFIKNILNKYDLPIASSLILLPIISIIGLPLYIYQYGVVWQEPIMLIVGWFIAGMGITIGYHRLFSHKAFKAKPYFEWILMISGSMALQNTIMKWCSDHRRHHSKLDTNEDPYSITEGFFHAHIGWILKRDDNYRVENVSDLEKKSAINFQNKYYWSMALSLSFILPMLIGLLYDRPFGGLLWGGILRVTLVHHFTFFINSLCHYFGKRNYDINTSAKDSWFMALFTFGEGYHNYHHKFQWDYRNGIKWYNFDPSKWIIKSLSFFKITYSLKEAPRYSILKAKINTINEKIGIISNQLRNKSMYHNKIKSITNSAMKNLDLLKKVELKYRLLDKNSISKKQKKIYKQKIKLYTIEIQKSVSALMIISMNIKNVM